MTQTSTASLGGSTGGLTIEHVLSDIERPYYYNLLATVSGDGQFTDERIIELLRKTGLTNPQLKEIWIKYANNNNRISKLQFFTMMRAVALYQGGVTEEVDQYLLARNFPYIPKISGISAPSLPQVQNPNPSHMNVAFAPIREEDQKQYEEVIDRVDFISSQSHTNVKGLLRASEAKNILLQSGLEQQQLKQIWDLCDRSEDASGQGTGKAFLKRNEWIVCLHLITYSKKGWPLPKVLPPELENFMSNYSQSRMQSEHGISRDSFINPNLSTTSFSNQPSWAQSQKEPYSHHQSTVIGDSTSILRTNTQPVMPTTVISNTGDSIRTQSQRDVAPPSQDLTVIMSLLDRILKGYEVVGKKYSDETETFLEQSKKLEFEKQKVLDEISAEIEFLLKEIEISNQVQGELEHAVAVAGKALQESGSTSKLDALRETFNREETMRNSFSLLESLKERLESGAFPISMEPLPSLSDQPRQHAHHSQVTTAFQPPQSPDQFHGQHTNHQTGHMRTQEEDDMFA